MSCCWLQGEWGLQWDCNYEVMCCLWPARPHCAWRDCTRLGPIAASPSTSHLLLAWDLMSLCKPIKGTPGLSGLEGASKAHLIPSPCAMGRVTFCWIRLVMDPEQDTEMSSQELVIFNLLRLRCFKTAKAAETLKFKGLI